MTEGDIVLPVDRIVIEKSSLNIVSPMGDYEIAYSGTIKAAPVSGLTADGTFRLTGGAAQADGTVSGKMAGSGAFDGTAEVTSVTVMTDGFAVASGQAEIAARGSLEGLGQADIRFALLNAQLAGVTLDTLDGDASYRPGSTRVDVALNSGNPRLSGKANLRIDMGQGGGPTAFGLDARVQAADFAGLEAIAGRSAEASGQVSLTLEGAVSDFTALSNDLNNRIVPRTLGLRGGLSLKDGRIRFADDDFDATAAGALDIAVNDGQLTLGTNNALSVSVKDRGSLRLSQQSGGKPLATLGPKVEPGEMELAAAVRLDATSYGSARGTLDGTLVIDPSAAAPVSAMPVTLKLAGERPIALNGFSISDLVLATTVRGGPDTFEGETTVSFGLDSTGEEAPARIDAGKVRVMADIGRSEGSIFAVVNDCATMQMKSVVVGSMTAMPGSLSLCAAQPKAPLADLRYSAANGASLALAGSLKTDQIGLKIERDAADPIALTMTLPPIMLSAAKPSGAAPMTASMSLANGTIDLPDYSTRIRNASIDVNLASTNTGWSADLRNLAGQLVDTHAAPLFTPFRFSAQGGLENGIGKGSARFSDSSDAFVITASGSYDVASGDGSAEFHSEPVTFSKNGLQPQRLFPILRGQVTSVSGGMSLNGDVRWRDGVMSSDADISVSNLGLETFITSIEGVDTTVHLDSLAPLSTPPGQRLTVKRLNPGMPFLDGEVIFQIMPDGDYVIENTSWPRAGGRLYAENIHIRPGADRYVLPLEVQNVDLAALAKLLDVKDLEISSTIGGVLPIVVEGDTPYIRGGHLMDDGKGGFIRYHSDAADNLFASGGPSASLAMKALNDFRFKSASVDIDGALTGDLDLGFHISGFNPNLYDGYPVEFNLGVQGKLGQLVRASMASMNITRELQQRLKEGQ